MTIVASVDGRPGMVDEQVTQATPNGNVSCDLGFSVYGSMAISNTNCLNVLPDPGFTEWLTGKGMVYADGTTPDAGPSWMCMKQ
jgi:hypothetical protein